jgi:hypothetical protein
MEAPQAVRPHAGRLIAEVREMLYSVDTYDWSDPEVVKEAVRRTLVVHLDTLRMIKSIADHFEVV